MPSKFYDDFINSHFSLVWVLFHIPNCCSPLSRTQNWRLFPRLVVANDIIVQSLKAFSSFSRWSRMFWKTSPAMKFTFLILSTTKWNLCYCFYVRSLGEVSFDGWLLMRQIFTKNARNKFAFSVLEFIRIFWVLRLCKHESIEL